MEDKKIMVPVVLGVILLCGIVFTLVYKKTDGTLNNNKQEVQTLAPKETEIIENKVIVKETKGNLDDFDINEIKPVETIETIEMELSNDIIVEDKDNELVTDSDESLQSNDDTNKVTVGIVDKSEDGTIIGLLPNGDAVSTLNTPDIGSSHVYTEAEAVALDSLMEGDRS